MADPVSEDDAAEQDETELSATDLDHAGGSEDQNAHTSVSFYYYYYYH